MSQISTDENTPWRQIDFYEALAEAQSDLGLGVLIADGHSRRFTFVNDAFCRLSGYAKEELLLLRNAYDIVGKESRDILQARTAMRLSGASLTDHYEVPILRKDGKRLVVEASVKRVEGNESKIVIIVQDVTERVKREQSIRAAYDVFDDLFNNAPCGYHSVGPGGEYLYINDTLLNWLGYTREEIVGKKKLWDLAAPEVREQVIESNSEFKIDCKPREISYDVIRKDGTRLPLLVRISAVVDKDGKFIMSRTVSFNNTERKIQEQKLRDLQRENLRHFEAACRQAITLFPDGRILRLEPAFASYFNLSPSEFSGQELGSFFENKSEVNEALAKCRESRGTVKLRARGFNLAAKMNFSGNVDAEFELRPVIHRGETYVIEIGVNSARLAASKEAFTSCEPAHYEAREIS